MIEIIESTDLVERASQYAAQKHASQKYGDKPYTYHLSQVSDVLTRFGFHCESMHAAAWLHDSLEDTDTTLDDLKSLFGEYVANLVWSVTDEPGTSRKERHEKTYPKTKKSIIAVIIKLADRTANAESSKLNNPKLFEMYKKEYPSFKAMLYSKHNLSDRMWEHLDGLLM